jgi:LDH2 family malate/lactate/ureidoglycolate dehydrogenase
MAQAGGIGIAGVRRSSHFGTGAFFVQQALNAGMLGAALTNAPANMPPHGGYRRYFGTNPLAIGIPAGEERPIILDMSTSVVARGKIVMMNKAGQDIPEGWALDEHGQPTRDSGAALRGVVLPFGDYKGSGLAFVIDVLCGVLTGAAFGPHIVDLYDEGERVQNLGHFFAAMDVETFMPAAIFRARMDQLIREVHGQPTRPGVERIFVPGEIEQEKIEESLRLGVPLAAAGMAELDCLAARFGVQALSDRSS